MMDILDSVATSGHNKENKMTQLYAVLQNKNNPNELKHIKIEEMVKQPANLLEEYEISEILEESDL